MTSVLYLLIEVLYCIGIQKVSKHSGSKVLRTRPFVNAKGAFHGETGLLKMVPPDIPNGKLSFIFSLCLIFDTSSKFSRPYFCFACHFCSINDEYKFQNFAYHLYKQ